MSDSHGIFITKIENNYYFVLIRYIYFEKFGIIKYKRQ